MASLVSKVEDTIKVNLKSGFRTTGIYPVDRDVAIKRLPDDEQNAVNSSDTGSSFNETLIEQIRVLHHLQMKRILLTLKHCKKLFLVSLFRINVSLR